MRERQRGNPGGSEGFLEGWCYPDGILMSRMKPAECEVGCIEGLIQRKGREGKEQCGGDCRMVAGASRAGPVQAGLDSDITDRPDGQASGPGM